MMMNQGPPQQQQPMQPQQQQGQQGQQGQNRFYVGGLDWNTGNDQLRAAFQIYGDLKDVHVMMADGRSKGYGFITFHDGVAAQEAGLLNGNISVDGREVTVSAAHPRGEARNAGGMGGGGFGAGGGGGRGAGPAAWGAGRQGGGGRGGGAGAEPNKIFVGGLSDEITEQDLTAYFNGFGTVSFVRVATDQETQRPRGFAFVCFEEAECAQRCVNSTVPHTINGCNLNVKMSKPKSQQGGFGGGGGGGGGGGFGGHQGGNDGGFGFRGGFGTMSSGREERGFGGGGGGGGNRFGNLGLGGSQPGGPPQQQQQPQQQGYPPRGAPSQNPGYGAHTGYSRPDAAPRGFNANPNPNANQAPVSISPANYGQNNYDAIASAFGIGGVGGGDYSNLGGFSNVPTQLPPQQQQPPQGNGY